MTASFFIKSFGRTVVAALLMSSVAACSTTPPQLAALPGSDVLEPNAPAATHGVLPAPYVEPGQPTPRFVQQGGG
jgi:hypothetical protein